MRREKSETVISYARRLGISHQRVSTLKKAGKLKLKGATIDHAASERMHRERLEAQKSSPSRQIKELYDAKMAKLDYEKAIGAVVEVVQVERDAFRVARVVRDAFMAIPDRLSGLLAAERDQKKIHAMLTKEFRQVLEVLSSEEPVSKPA